jgi:hypothetical protein
MLRKVLATVLLLGALSGCTVPARTCTSDADCQSNGGDGLCDTQVKLCYAGNKEIDNSACTPACAPYEACTGAKVCVQRYSALVVTPGDGGLVGKGAVPVRAELLVDTTRFAANFPETLRFSAVREDGGTGGTFDAVSTDAGIYTTQWTPAGDGVFLLTAAYPTDGGPRTTVHLTVDATPPTFVVTVPPIMGGSDGGTTYGDPELVNAWSRDQVVPVEIRTNESNLDPSTVMVALKGTDGGLAPVVGVTPLIGACDAGFCGVAQLKLWEPSFDAFRGSMPIVVQGRDSAGNPGGTSSSPSVNVTRWKWVFDASSGGTFAIKTPPAIGTQGLIYFGASAVSTGKVFALRPDGFQQWAVNTGTVISGPTVGSFNSGVENVYFGVQSSSTLASLVALNGSTGDESARCDINRGQITSNLVLTQSSPGGNAVEAVVGVFNVSLNTIPPSTIGSLVALRPEGAATPCNSTDSVARSPVTASSVGPLVIEGDTVFYSDTSGRLTSYQLGSATARQGWPVPTNFLINALALVGSNVLGTNGGGSFSDKGQLFSIPKTGGGAVPLWTYPSSADLFVNQLSVGQANAIFFGAENLPSPSSRPGFATVTLGGNKLDVVQSGTGSFKGTPAVGRGGMLYGAAGDGALGMVGAWSTDGFSNHWMLNRGIGSIVNSPALDCARDETGTARAENLGTLYVAEGGKLYAFVVDSRGLDPDAPWPKYQHDARNTGNPNTPISSCP